MPNSTRRTRPGSARVSDNSADSGWVLGSGPCSGICHLRDFERRASKQFVLESSSFGGRHAPACRGSRVARRSRLHGVRRRRVVGRRRRRRGGPGAPRAHRQTPGDGSAGSRRRVVVDAHDEARPIVGRRLGVGVGRGGGRAAAGGVPAG